MHDDLMTTTIASSGIFALFYISDESLDVVIHDRNYSAAVDQHHMASNAADTNTAFASDYFGIEVSGSEAAVLKSWLRAGSIGECPVEVTNGRQRLGYEYGDDELEDLDFGALFTTFCTKMTIKSEPNDIFDEEIEVETDPMLYCRDIFSSLTKDSSSLDEKIEWWNTWGARRHAAEIALIKIRATDPEVAGVPEEDGDLERDVVALESFFDGLPAAYEAELVAAYEVAIQALEATEMGHVSADGSTVWLELEDGTSLGIHLVRQDERLVSYDVVDDQGESIQGDAEDLPVAERKDLAAYVDYLTATISELSRCP